MKLHLTILFLIIPLALLSQEKNMVTVEANVSDFSDNARVGEQIIFESQQTGKTYKGVSNKNGNFAIEIPGPDTYMIKIKGIGSEKDYQKFKIPELQPNQSYGVFELTVKFNPPKLFTLDNVFFDTGKATLRPKSIEELNELKEYLELKPDIRVEIAGHTDNVGSDESNKELSRKRAQSVKNWLVKKGISSDRIETKGYGESRPRATNKTKEGKQKNRRTEVRILN